MNTQANSKAVSLSIATLLLPAGLTAQTAPPAASAKKPWTFSASIAAKEGFDSNVFLQDEGDQAGRESWVTAILPSVGVAYQQSPAFKASFSYAPDVVFYHSDSSEDHVDHRAALNFGGTSGNTSWDLLNGLLWIDGSSLGPIYTTTSGGVTQRAEIPALGAIPVRDRRDAAIYRNSFKLTQTMGKAFLRPIINSYVHDFQTEQHAPVGAFVGYENYIDRYDVGGGLDVGYAIAAKTWLLLGYRFGYQHQGHLLGAPSLYSNYYNRFLVGVEGAPTEWLKLNVLAGPDVRDFPSATPPAFNRNELLYFVDASVSLMPTKQDTVTLAARRYEQPAFVSGSMYEDIVYDLSYRHRFSAQFTAGAGFRFYGGNWQAPVNREEWIYTPSAILTYTHDKHLSGELAYSYDWVDTKVPSTEGREFTRHLCTLGLKYAF